MQTEALKTAQSGDDFIVYVQGRLTHRVYDDLIFAMDNMVAACAKRLVFDLSGLAALDSAGIGLLLMCLDIAKGHNISGVMQGADGTVARLLRTVHLDEMFVLA